MYDAMAAPACGTAGCIGGHAAVKWPSVRSTQGVESYTFNEQQIAKKMGLSKAQIMTLCFPGQYKEIPRKKAVSTLRRLARTGVVHWKNMSYPIEPVTGEGYDKNEWLD